MKHRADNYSTVGISYTEVANVSKNPQISSRKRTQHLEDIKDVLSKILDTLTKPRKRCVMRRNSVTVTQPKRR